MEELETDVTFFDFPSDNSDEVEELSEYEDIFPPRSKDDIEGLLYLGKLTQIVNVYGHDFTLNTLTTGEELAVSLLVKKWEGTVGISKAFMTATIAASVSSVNGRPFYTPITVTRNSQHISDKFNKILEWHFPVVQGLFDEYTKMVERQTNAFRALEGKSQRSQ